MFLDFLNLFYPKLCLCCGQNHVPAQEWLCLTCQFKLPKTGFHLMPENALTERFWGRLPLTSGAAMYYFTKGGRTQQLIHNFKYNGKRQIGEEIGKMYGLLLKEAPLFKSVDLIIPVPLHPKKQRKRGFNQSASFARGLATSMNIGWSEKYLNEKHTLKPRLKNRGKKGWRMYYLNLKLSRQMN